MKGKISIIAALICAIIFSVTWYLMARSMGFYEISVYRWRNIMTYALVVIGVFFSVLLTRRSNDGRLLEFKEALKAGMLFALVFAALVAFFNYCYYTLITPDTIDYFISEAKKELLLNKTVKPADIPKILDSERANFGSFRLIPPILFQALIVSLLSGLLLQKKPPHSFHEN